MRIGREFIHCTDTESTSLILDTHDTHLREEVIGATRHEMDAMLLDIKPSSAGLRFRAQKLFETGQTMPELPPMEKLSKVSVATDDPQKITWLRLASEAKIDLLLSPHLAQPVANHFARMAFTCLELANGLEIENGVDINDRPALIRRWMSYSEDTNAAKRTHNTIRYANLQRAAWNGLASAHYLAKGYGFTLDMTTTPATKLASQTQQIA